MIDMRLRKKILLSFLSLFVASSILTISAVLLATNNSVEDQAREKLVVGRKVFEQLLELRANQLFESAEVLTSDFGFKAAVLDKDRATITSVLDNHGARIEADVMMIASLDGELIASTRNQGQLSEFPFKSLLPVAEKNGGTMQTVILDGAPFKVLMLPVRAPITLAWAVVGFEIDQSLANELKELTTLEVTFTGGVDNRQPFELTTFDSETNASKQIVEIQNEWIKMNLGDEPHLAQVTELTDADDYHVSAILSTSLMQAKEKFSPLKLQILVIATIALVLSAFVAFIIARNISRPVNVLVSAAERISRGDYTGDIQFNDYKENEIGKLANSISEMQLGIAEREDRIIFQAYHDTLTGLANRANIQEKTHELIKKAESETVIFALMQINVKQFKQVNNTFGYQVGDRLLIEIAHRLSEALSEGDLAARLGGDEFLLLLNATSEDQIRTHVLDIFQQLSLPYQIEDLNIPIYFVCGVASYPYHGTQTDELMRRADIALHEANEHQQALLFYEPGTDEKHIKQTQLVNDLKEAISQDSLVMFYQPKLDLREKKVTQVEALIRWIHPEFGFIPPDQFIGLAEQSGLMPELTRWVLKDVLKQAARWQTQGIDLKVAVNLSAYDLANDDLPEFIANCLASHSLETSALILEVTESAMIDNPEQALKVLNQLKAQGIVLAIDDYGTGYSSLSQLKDLPVDELKIDMSFVLKLDESTYDQAIVESTIKMGHKLGLTIVAEGVENRASWQLLEEWGCEKLQGYYISRPQNADDFTNWFQSYDITKEYR